MYSESGFECKVGGDTINFKSISCKQVHMFGVVVTPFNITRFKFVEMLRTRFETLSAPFVVII